MPYGEKSAYEAKKKLKSKSYAMKGFPEHQTVDLTKKSGFGPRAAKGSDDQSKELAKSKYEMGEYKIDPTETDAETERREDAEGK